MSPQAGEDRLEASSRALDLFAAFIADHGATAGEAADGALEKLCGEHRELAVELRELWTNWERVTEALPRMPATTSLPRKLRKLYGPDVDPGVSIDAPGNAPDDSGYFAQFFRRLRERGAPGTRYAVHDVLGRGGMGIVYSVWDEDLRRHLAMKVIRHKGESETAPPRVGKTPTPKGEVKGASPAPHLIDPLSLGRFLEEAQITGQLNHPGIVPVHEIGLDADGRVYFTMRQVRGATFAQVIDWVKEGNPPTSGAEAPGAARAGGSPWNETRALSVLVSVCDALAYAHSKGVVHRDLKPANVMVGRFGEVYVMDWGLARVLGLKDRHDVRPRPAAQSTPLATDRRDAASSRDDSPIVTMDGAVVGTPSYMSPEQAFGRPDEIDRRSDVYSVGAMLYHLLTRRMPYVEPDARVSQHTILAAVQMGPPKRVHELRADVPVELEAICEKAIARKREERYADTQALAADLRAFLEHRVVTAYETGAVAELKKWMERNKALAASLAAFVLLVVGVAGFVAWQRSIHNTEIAEKNLELTQTNLDLARSTAAALAAQNDAEGRLAEVTRLSDIKRVRDLEARASKLWPAWPERVAEMQKWIADARDVVDRLPAHEQSLARLREQALRPDADTQLQWWHDQLEELVAAIHALDGPLAEPPDALAAWKLAANEAAPAAVFVPSDATLHAMQRRIDHAAWVEQVSLDDEVDAWAAAIERIAKSPKYGGLKLKEQLGLVPSGPDPESTLEEFWHVETGARPKRDEKSGHVVIADATGLVFVLLPGGKFTMGSRLPDDQHPLGSPNVDPRSQTTERPPHEVTLSPYFMSKYEMTQAQWLRTAGSNPSWFSDAGIKTARPLTSPVEQVCFTDVDEHTVRLGIGLPTEAQWEYGARAGTTTVWWVGDDVAAIGPDRGRAGNIFDQSAKKAGYPGDAANWDDRFDEVAPVGSFAPNRFGLHDVLGNVWEWCADEYCEDYRASPARSGDGLRALAVQSGPRSRATRGGSWSYEAVNARSAYRIRSIPSFRGNVLGLRPARVIAE